MSVRHSITNYLPFFFNYIVFMVFFLVPTDSSAM